MNRVSSGDEKRKKGIRNEKMPSGNHPDGISCTYLVYPAAA